MTDTAAASHSARATRAKHAGAGPFSLFERMVAWRYLRSKRKETVISVIASISFIGIMLAWRRLLSSWR